ncbi:MAG: carbohydrate ABC transporter permease, partial [Chloroflexi bacterium]|nr:carbohydrate ABC transporter permease [Chloroflexota bacterium]
MTTRVTKRPFPRLGDALFKGLVYLALLLGAASSVFPFLWMLSTSFKDRNQAITLPIRWLPDPFTLENYRLIWEGNDLARNFLNSVIVSLAVTGLMLITCSMAGYAFAKKSFWGKELIFTILIGTMTIPGFVMLVPLFLLIIRLGMYDQLIGVIIPFSAGVFGIFLMRQFISTIPDELLDAARVDGASELRIWWRIVVPLSSPALATLAIFTFQGNWNAFLWPLILLDSKDKWTLMLALVRYSREYSAGLTDWPIVMAGVVIAILPLFVVFLALQRYFFRG